MYRQPQRPKKGKGSKGKKQQPVLGYFDGAAKHDVILLLAVLLLLVVGLATVYSASSYLSEQRHGDSGFFFKGHLIRLAFGLLVMVVVMYIPYRLWLAVSGLLYGHTDTHMAQSDPKCLHVR